MLKIATGSGSMILKIYGPRWVNVREQSQAESNAGFISLKK